MIELSLLFGIPYSMLRSVISERDFRLYRLYSRVYGPIGTRRDDYRTAMIIAHQCAKYGDTIEKFLPKFTYREVEEDDEPKTFEQQLEKTLRVMSEITKQHRGEFRQGPLMTLEFKPGELRRIKRNGDGSDSGG